MKRCNKCGISKDESEFYTDSSRADGLTYRCKACIKAAGAKYVAKHRGERRAYSKRYYAEHSDERKEYMTTYDAKHRDEHKAYMAKYYIEHPDRAKTAWIKRRALIAGSEGSFTIEEWLDLLEKYNYMCLCCSRDDAELTIDHVVPLSLGGSNDISNIQPLCLTCNLSKGVRTVDYRLNYPVEETK
jgi:5-methylcytosine-specific restriction endonuclease McrA